MWEILFDSFLAFDNKSRPKKSKKLRCVLQNAFKINISLCVTIMSKASNILRIFMNKNVTFDP